MFLQCNYKSLDCVTLCNDVKSNHGENICSIDASVLLCSIFHYFGVDLHGHRHQKI